MLGYLFGFDVFPIREQRYHDKPVQNVLPEHQVLEMARRIDALELACAGLWELLKQTSDYTDEELVAAIQEVDAKDGVIDGKIRPTVGNCPNCNQKLLTRAGRNCAWCGATVTPAIPFGNP